MTESNILPYDGQAILIDDHGAEFDWPAITRALIDTIPWQVDTARIFGREAGRSKLESPSRCSRGCEEEDRTLKPKQEPVSSSLEGGIIAFTGRLASMGTARLFAVKKIGGVRRQDSEAKPPAKTLLDNLVIRGLKTPELAPVLEKTLAALWNNCRRGISAFQGNC